MKEYDKDLLRSLVEQEQPEEQPEGWKARMLEKFQKRV